MKFPIVLNFSNVNVKSVLAFFLVVIAAALVVFLTLVLISNTKEGKATLDPGTIALLAGFVTTFILMAKSAADYQYSSSAGSDKKDETSANVQRALADKVPGAPGLAQLIIVWWSVLTDEEKQKITTAAPADPKVMAFVTAANVGKATPEDLHYLVAQGLLTQERATVIEKT